MQKGDIYLVDFDPSIGHEYQKKRPAVIVQNMSCIKNPSLVTIMPITSSVQKKLPCDIAVAKTDRNHLYVDSVVKVLCVTSFDKGRLLKQIGVMEKTIMHAVDSYLKVHFGLE